MLELEHVAQVRDRALVVFALRLPHHILSPAAKSDAISAETADGLVMASATRLEGNAVCRTDRMETLRSSSAVNNSQLCALARETYWFTLLEADMDRWPAHFSGGCSTFLSFL